MEIWDGYFRDGTRANIDLVRETFVPDGLYHLVCEVLVRHTDGDYLLMQRDFSKPKYGGYYEATAGGSALKGESQIDCIKRELYEETGIFSNYFEELGHFVFDDSRAIFYTFLCITDCDKTAVTCQAGETISYKWLTEPEFIAFIHSGKMIDRQKARYSNYFSDKGYL